MRYSKKGDLAISTNAIVILIIAVIMLGLIIGFVTKAFGSVSENFEKEFSKVPNPVAATASTPVTATETVIGHVDEAFKMKAAVYNSDPTSAITGETPTITCADGGITASANSQDIPSRKAAIYGISGKVDSAVLPGQYLCQVKASVGSADFFVDVKK